MEARQARLSASEVPPFFTSIVEPEELDDELEELLDEDELDDPVLDEGAEPFEGASNLNC